MGQSKSGIFNLSFTGQAVKLQIHLVQHSEARSTNGMAEAFQAAVDLAGYIAVMVEYPVHHIAPGPAALGDMQIFHGNQFRDGKAVVHLHHADLFLWICDPCLLVCFRTALAGCYEMVSVPIVVAHFLTAAERQLQALDGDDIFFAQLLGQLRRGNDGAGGTVADTATVKKSERMGNNGRSHDLILRNRLAQMRFGIQDPIGMAFGGYMCHSPFQIPIRNFVFGTIRACKLGKGAGRRHVRKPLPGQAARIGACKTGQTAVTGILEFLHSQSQGKIVGAGSHGITCAAKSLGAGSAEVFNPGGGNIGKPKGH